MIKLFAFQPLYILQYEIQKFIDVLFSLSNPLLYLILFLFIFAALLILYKKNIIIPIRNEHETEKTRLVQKHIKEMALFAELDPNPLLRINLDGEIIAKNSAADFLIKNGNLNGRKVREIINYDLENIESIVNDNETITITREINERFYIVIIKGISEFKAAQLYFNDVSSRELAERKLREYQKQFDTRVEMDRKSFARELHDGIGQDLSFLRLSINNLKDYLDENEKSVYQDTVKSIDKMGEDLRAICNELRPRILEEEGLAPAISALISDNNKRNKLRGSINFIGESFRLDAEVETNLFRVAQEAINNIVKHSKANEFLLQIINNKNEILIIISDDGIGFNTNSDNNNSRSKKSFGLVTMRERIESIGGNIKFESEINNGTTILIKLPFKEVNES
jgi:signal transduction histidine kinase